MSESPVITIDGPSGVGKGTVCQYLAKKTGWHLLDSGAIYRVLAFAAITGEIPLDDENKLSELARGLNVTFQQSANTDKIDIYLENNEISNQIRAEECGNAASQLARYSLVRQALLGRQREFSRAPGLIADGRDMGSVVFPAAQVKIFLTASPEERLNRRYKQLKEQGFSVNLARLSADIAERDNRDQLREESPLKPAMDAVVIDTTTLRIEQVINQIWEIVESKIPELNANKA
ncbi:MAG: (d)CMP kinase [Gammaproteobacteria bacterium]|nr:(d)CMP kinase [Gammaproteobacteria bacterium]